MYWYKYNLYGLNRPANQTPRIRSIASFLPRKSPSLYQESYFPTLLTRFTPRGAPHRRPDIATRVAFDAQITLMLFRLSTKQSTRVGPKAEVFNLRGTSFPLYPRGHYDTAMNLGRPVVSKVMRCKNPIYSFILVMILLQILTVRNSCLSNLPNKKNM